MTRFIVFSTMSFFSPPVSSDEDLQSPDIRKKNIKSEGRREQYST
jgi:hypothetical protein